MPFHFKCCGFDIAQRGRNYWYVCWFTTKPAIKKIAPVWLTNSPLLNVKFSKALIFVFTHQFQFCRLFLQLSFFAIQHYFITPFYLIIPALVIAIFFTVFMIHCLDQVIKPKLTHTNYNLLGRLATISSGSARPGFSAQARVRDEFGQLHYVQVEPEYGELELYSQVILIKVHKSHYVAKKFLFRMTFSRLINY